MVLMVMPNIRPEASCDYFIAEPTIRVLLVADVRSPTTWGWVDAIRSAGIIVLGLNGKEWPENRAFYSSGQRSRIGARQQLASFASATPRRLKLTQGFRRTTGPLLASMRSRRLKRAIARTRPDIIHALRIPCEAMEAAAACPQDIPLAVSIWGNDLTLQASINRLIARATRRVLMETNLLFADCQRDIDLAKNWGLQVRTATSVLPGGGGIDLARVAKAKRVSALRLEDLEWVNHRLIVNPRGCREYVRNDILLEALSLLRSEIDSDVRIVFVDAAHDEGLRRRIENHSLSEKIIVTEKLAPTRILSLFCRTEISVSITEHDGTPNSLLEAMAAGAIPVCGDIPSIREWIVHGTNGFLAPSDNPRAVADALLNSLQLSDVERSVMRAENCKIIATRAERNLTGMQAAEKYRELVQSAVGVVQY
jgi:glycosyl transferase family 1/glycosyl transferase family 4